jgi:hypothetical protein
MVFGPEMTKSMVKSSTEKKTARYSATIHAVHADLSIQYSSAIRGMIGKTGQN